MALVVKDRVKQTTTTTGTGSLVLNGTVDSFQTFTSALADADTTYYALLEPSTNSWEVGLGTWTESTTTLARTTILESSNSGSAINLTAGEAEVFITQPAEKAVYLDASGNINPTGNVDVAGTLDVTGAATFDDSVTIQGDLTINGTTTTVSATNLAIEDNMIYLNDGSTTTNPDLGWAGNYNDGTYAHAGVFRDASDGTFKLYDGYTPEPGAAIDTTHASFTLAPLDTGALSVEGNVTVTGTVDGRDVASDGSKLDGIEAGATGDQSASEILTAVKTVDGSGSGLDADLLDGQQGSYYLDWTHVTNKPDPSVTLSGDVSGSATMTDLGSINITTVVANDSHTHDGRYYTETEVGNFFSGTTAITGYNKTNWDTAYGWGDHASANYLAASSYTASDVLTKIKTVDGAASGLDADLLDGQHGSYYYSPANAPDPTLTLNGDVSGSATFTNLGNATLTATVANNSHSHVPSNITGLIEGTTFSGTYPLLFGIDDTTGRIFEHYNITFNGTTNALTINGGTAWHSGNDGSGSGLDADLIDGVGFRNTNSGVPVNADTLDQAGHTYYTSGVTDFSGNANDGALYSQVYSTAWQHQIAGDYRSGQIAVRGKNNGTWQPWYKVWSENNDGSGSGLDADLWDGQQFSSYLNQSVKTDASPTFANTYVAGGLYHSGDTNTALTFGTDTITLSTGGSSEITVNTTGVRLGDTGNGYFQPVSGDYGSIQIDGGAHTSWEGYSIGGRVVFMHDNSNSAGIYNDVNNHWMVMTTLGGAVQLFHNNSSKLDTLSNGVSINGNLYTDGSNAEDYDALSGTSVTCNVDNAGAFSLTMTGNTTFTFSGADSGWSMGFVLQLTGNGGTVTWPASVDWAGGTAPDAPASGETDIYVFWTRDGGTTWYGVLSVDAAA